jgi:DNA topoisomerase-1
MDYEFTEKVSEELDLIASGNRVWYDVVKSIYNTFHPKVLKLIENSKKLGKDGKQNREKHKLRRVLGDNKDGKSLIVYLGKYGPLIQIGNYEDHKKNRFVPIPKEMSLDTITLEDALNIVNSIGSLGIYNEKSVELKKGRYGYYLIYDNNNISIPDIKSRDMSIFTIEHAIEILKENETNGGSASGVITEFSKTLQIRKGPYGNYIRHGKKNIKLPVSIKDDLEKLKVLTKKEVMELIQNAPVKRAYKGKSTTKPNANTVKTKAKTTKAKTTKAKSTKAKSTKAKSTL